VGVKQQGNNVILALLAVGVVASLVLSFGTKSQISKLNETSSETTSSSKEEVGFKALDKDKYQAIFLKGSGGESGNGQVYFGKVTEVNSAEVELKDIYYLRNGSVDSSSEDISLAKLGCELHGPEDHMSISRDDISFWENLKDDGQVVKAIEEFKRANPRGQSCDV
jgi:hypothetical protein